VSKLPAVVAPHAQQAVVELAMPWEEMIDKWELEQAGSDEAARQEAHEIRMPSEEQQSLTRQSGHPVFPRMDR
jgi:hypothetical protein